MMTASRYVCNIGVIVDRHLEFKKLVSRIVSLCLRHITKMSRYYPMQTTEHHSIMARNCNSLLYGTSINDMARLHSTHNSAAMLILRRPRSTGSTCH